jgi:ribonucleoside-diphosphate reductase alpha chain
LAAIGAVIERHMIDTGFLKPPAEGERPVAESLQVAGAFGAAAPGAAPSRRLRQCPKCGAASLIHQEGCDLCTSCGHSKCV